MTDDQTPPTLAEILAACLAVQAIYAERDAAEAQTAATGPALELAGAVSDGRPDSRHPRPRT